MHSVAMFDRKEDVLSYLYSVLGLGLANFRRGASDGIGQPFSLLMLSFIVHFPNRSEKRGERSLATCWDGLGAERLGSNPETFTS